MIVNASLDQPALSNSVYSHKQCLAFVIRMTYTNLKAKLQWRKRNQRYKKEKVREEEGCGRSRRWVCKFD